MRNPSKHTKAVHTAPARQSSRGNRTIARDLRRARTAIARNDIAGAEVICNRLLASHPRNPDVRGLTGIVAVKSRRLEQALALLPKAAASRPRDPDLRMHLGAALLLLGRSEEALPHLDRAVTLAPDDPVALNVFACALGNLKRLDESIACCNRALKLRPGYLHAHVNRGNAYAELGRHEAALADFKTAIAIDPKSLEAINNCANTLKALGRHGEAAERYEQALQLHPDFAEAAFNLGVTLAEMGQPRAAVTCYLRVLDIQPDHLLARYNMSLCRLLLGDFSGAWRDHASWIQRSERDGKQRRFAQPRWTGASDLAGKTILLHADEGLGDTIQFSRYAREVASLGARVILEVQRPLVKILRGAKAGAKVIARGDELPRFDLHCPIMSLPAALSTTLKTIPEHGPYIHSDARRDGLWRKRLVRTDRRALPRIGLVWSGNPAHANDSNRSLNLSETLPLLRFDADWISLQKDIRPNDAECLAGQSTLRHFGDSIRDFSDTVALVAQTDLVIAVDTSVAHLAGAMGKPVWILLPYFPDWRWLLKRKDSPWYPSARLFRQPRVGDWASVLRSVRRALTERYKR